jgi:hypothetical protein
MSLAGMVILALVAGLGGAVVAQEEEEMLVTATRVTGTKVSQVWDDSQAAFTTDEHGVEGMRGMPIRETFEWSDERLPALKTGIWHNDAHWLSDSEAVLAWTGANRLDGPEGSWSGTATGFWEPMANSGFGLDIYVGEGPYEGLTAVFQCTGTTCDGYILESGLPPMPDPIEPPSE